MKRVPATLAVLSLLAIFGCMWAHALHVDQQADEYLNQAHGCALEGK